MDILPPSLPPDTGADALTTGRRSAGPSRVEVLVRAERRRSWLPERKREIVAEMLGGGCKPGEVARRHGISTGQLYTWRRELFGMRRAVARNEPPRFAPVELASGTAGMTAVAALPGPEVPRAPVRPAGLIEIVLSGGVSLRVDAAVDARALRRVLSALGAQ